MEVAATASNSRPTALSPSLFTSMTRRPALSAFHVAPGRSDSCATSPNPSMYGKSVLFSGSPETSAVRPHQPINRRMRDSCLSVIELVSAAHLALMR